MNYNPNTKEKIEIVMTNYRMFGLWNTVKAVLIHYLYQDSEDNFDEKYGVSTREASGVSEANITNELDLANALSYSPTRETAMWHILKNVTKGLALNEFSFIDFGSGKGRVLIIAAQYPFRKVIGVEVSPVLCDIAASNVQCYLSSHHDVQCRDIGVHCESALDFDLPDTNLLIYMYRPFYAELLKKVLDKLSQFQAATGRQVFLVYSCAVDAECLEEHQGFVKRIDYEVLSLKYSWMLWECCLGSGPNTGSYPNEFHS